MDIKSFALSTGILLAAITLLISLWYSLTGFGAEIIAMVESFYGKMTIVDMEFSKSVPFIQNLWKVIVLSIFSFVDGAILGSLFAILHNLFIPKKNEKETK